MPQQYTVPTTNPYALLADDSDNEDAILSKPEEKSQAVAEPARQAGKPAVNEDAAARPQRPRDNNGQPRGPRRAEGGAPRKPRDGNSPSGGNDIVDGEARRAISNRGRGGAPGGGPARFSAPRGGGAPRPAREGQREFDRRSGTGRGTEMKKEGAGAHNWGKPTDYAAEVRPGFPKLAVEPGSLMQEGIQNEWAPSGGDQEGLAMSGGEAQVAGAGGEESGGFLAKEDSQTTTTPAAPALQSYAQYKAARAEKQSALPTHKLEAGASDEAKQQKLIQDGYQIYTKESTLAASPEDKEDRETDEDKLRPRTMHLAEVAEKSGVMLNYGGRGQRGGRGGRGGAAMDASERRGNGKPPGAAQASQPTPPKEINLSDKQAFPTLQAH